MTKMEELTIGMDISKDFLDLHELPGGKTHRLANAPSGYRSVARVCAGRPVARVVYEPTGPYHAGLEAALAGRLPLVKVNPLQARRFAQACGTRAKTDAVDARMLARMGVALTLVPDRPAVQDQSHLKELHQARTGLARDQTRLRNRLATQSLPLTRRLTRARLAQIERQIAALDKAIAQTLTRCPGRARAREILCSIPGIGPISASALLIECPELGTLTRKQVASLAGLAPMTRASGRWHGIAVIQGGRKPLRDALYMPALVAARHNPDLSRKYLSLREAGKPAKLAIIALMRKLIELANALIAQNRLWTPKHP